MEQLDKDILAWIAAHNDDAALSAQIASAQVTRRDYMRTGFFVYFDTAPESPAIADELRPRCPDIDAPGLLDGAGSSLFLKNGRLHYLEIYARGGFFPESPEDYRLLDPAD